jgi:endonuclease-3
MRLICGGQLSGSVRGKGSEGSAEAERRRLGAEILKRLRGAHRLNVEEFVSSYVSVTTGSPFRVLVATVLSQNSTDRAAMRAYIELERRIGVVAERLSKVDVRRIARAIRVAGLSDQKARTIKRLASLALKLEDPELRGLLTKGPEAARETLLEVKGIGPKTVDVLLASTGTLDTVPVDTHVRRVSEKLGLVGGGARYEEVRSALEEVFPEGSRYEAHLLLIAHGRSVCRSRRTLCEVCALSDLCNFYNFKYRRKIQLCEGLPRRKAAESRKSRNRAR